MSILLDTNIVLVLSKADDARHSEVARRIRELEAGHAELCLAPQVIYEFWVVATRPVEVNGLGASPASVRQYVQHCLDSFTLRPEPPDLLHRWLELCTVHSIKGKRAHDARLVAWMLSHGIEQLLTFNTADFAAFGEIKARMPAAV